MESNYLICYDICDPKRWARLFRLMKGMGLHLQYSVFFCRLTYQQLMELKMRINGIINKTEDDVRIYPLPQNSIVEVLGMGSRVPEEVFAYL